MHLCPIGLVIAVASTALAAPNDYFRIHVVDEQTGRGVPLVKLRTVNDVAWYTDSNGLIAFNEPGLMNGQDVHFLVSGHGYEYPADGFGYRGVRLQPTPGGRAEVKLKRLNIAERLYRITGGGIYRDTVLLGEKSPTDEPVLNARVLGSDSVSNAIYHGKLYWIWGDTNWPAYPLGNFQTPCAVSNLPGKGGLDPSRGVNLRYFTAESGFAKASSPTEGQGPTWIDALTVLKDGEGHERFLAAYGKIKPPMECYRRGLLEWSDEKELFVPIGDFDMKAPVWPRGHTFLHKDGGTEYVYFATPYPHIRVPAAVEAFTDIGRYEAFTCLEPGTKPEDERVERDADGKVVYAWKRGTSPVGPKEQAELIKTGRLREEEAWLKLRDADSGKPVMAASGSVAWNTYRKRWIMITCQIFGTSVLGEQWYAEADAPEGPWINAVKVVTHDKYSFYNTRHHPCFDQDGGRLIYFEGTYTATFSGNEHPTPRYDYNQIMYRLDLADPRLAGAQSRPAP